MADLLSLFAELDDPDEDHRLPLRSWRGPRMLAQARCVPDGPQFRFNNEGAPCWIVPVWDRATPMDDGLDGWTDCLFDMIAIEKGQEARWRTYCGETLLGEIWVDRARHFNEPLNLYSTPFEWIRARGAGAVILDWDEFPILALSGIQRVICDTDALAKRFMLAVRRPYVLPDVRIARGDRHAA